MYAHVFVPIPINQQRHLYFYSAGPISMEKQFIIQLRFTKERQTQREKGPGLAGFQALETSHLSTSSLRFRNFDEAARLPARIR